jgi:ribonucleoside-triphosphate reductase
MKNINRKPGDPNYDLFKLALKSTSLRLYPNYVNCDWSVDLGYDINNPETYPSTMGCRTFSSWDINADKPELKHLKDGRGNISPVTIILPTLAMQAKEKAYDGKNIIDIFMKLLDKKSNQAKDMLIERFDWQCSQSYKSAKFMYENGTIYGYKPEEGIRSALKHGTFGIGQLGLAECLQILIEKDHTTEDGLQLAIKIETLFKEKCAKFKKDLKLNFGVYFTPSENLSFTALKRFK